jgi:hypothetical protein
VRPRAALKGALAEDDPPGMTPDTTTDVRPDPTPTTTPPSSDARRERKAALGSALMLPVLFVVAWGFALSGSKPPGAITGEATSVDYLRWMLYFTGFVFVFSSIMHSVFRKHTAASIGWQTNGFELELAAVSLGLGLACFYAVYNHMEAMVTVSIPIVAFLFLAGVNHVVEIVREGNDAPNNTLILIWDFGISISLVALLLGIGRF